jgi:CheY-like chemotaxis protein/two-component sensor histidine kinase
MMGKANERRRQRADEALAQALRRSEESDRLKSAFLANMSHEIRTPLNVILGYNEIIRQTAGADHPALGEMLDAIQRASERLVNTVHAALDLARLQSGSFECRRAPLDVAECIAEEVRCHEAIAKSKGLSLRFIAETAAVVSFDEYCLVKTVRALLDNAIKFTREGEVTVRLFREGRDQLLLEVRDTGIGIADSFLPRLLDPFTQEEDGDSRTFDGAGVGLALAKGMLELNGAHLSVASEKGRGTTVRVHFERRMDVTHPMVVPAAAGSDEGDKPVLLLVEDDLDCQVYVETILAHSYRVLKAATAGEVREALARHLGRIRGVLMDVTLPDGEDGLTLTRYLRSRPEWRDVPVVATTARELAEWRVEAFEAGCDAFLAKPFTPRQLLAVVDGFIGHR